jgi:hypothetical protein
MRKIAVANPATASNTNQYQSKIWVPSNSKRITPASTGASANASCSIDATAKLRRAADRTTLTTRLAPAIRGWIKSSSPELSHAFVAELR